MVKTVPAMRLEGVVVDTLAANGEHFVTGPQTPLVLDWHGVAGDLHCGPIRKAGAREPWYPKGLEIRNERQLSILSVGELAAIAKALDVDKIEASWIGANLVLDGIDDLTFLPPRTILNFAGGAALRVDGYNGPCRFAGAEVAKALNMPAPEKDGEKDWLSAGMAFEFVQAAHLKRGLVAWVEIPGEISPGEAVTARIHEQWLYE